MSDYLVTYDLADGSPDPHKPFLTAAETEGLLYVWQGQSYVSRLPDTTVWGVFRTTSDAIAAFDRAIEKAERKVGYSIKLEKRCTVKVDDTTVKSDRRKKPEARWTGASSFETSRLHQLNDPYFK